MSTLAPPNPRDPFVDAQGRITPVWFRWIGSLFLRVGGGDAPTNIDLSIDMPEDAGLEELRAALFELDRTLSVQPTSISQESANDTSPPLHQEQFEQPLETQVRALAEEVTKLRSQLEAIQQEPTT